MDAGLAETLGFAARTQPADDGAAVVLFVHGLGCDATFWDEAWSAPGLEPYALLAVDLPGFGAAPALGQFTFAAVVERLALLIEALDGPVVAVGHSMGGTLVAQTACDGAPLRGAVLVEANLAPTTPTTSASAAGALAVAEGRFDGWFAALERWAGEHADDGPADARFARSLRRADRETFAAACCELVAASAGDVASRFAALTLPRVYVLGDELEEEHADAVRRHGLDTRHIARAGHSVMIDQPERFYGFLAGWIDNAISR